MADLKSTLTETLRAHQFSRTEHQQHPSRTVDICNCGWRSTFASRTHNEHVADVLLGLPGVAVTALPEPCKCGNEWLGGREKVFYTPDDEIADVSVVAPVTGSGEAQLVFIDDPRALAAALLAAAVVSEGER